MDHSSLPPREALPPLEALRTFEVAARAGSFSAAAVSLNITHGAVSRQIARLEHWLGLKVFERKSRGVTLTPDGQRLYLRANEAFALIADNSQRWTEQRGSAVVRLSALPSVSGLWLMPRLQALESEKPSLRIALTVEQRHADLADEGIDLAIRCGRAPHPNRVSLKLIDEPCVPVAAPALARTIAKKGPAARLLDHPLIHDSDATGWRAWFAAAGIDLQPRAHDRRFEDYHLVLDAASNGLGIALARPSLSAAHFKDGRLVAIDARQVMNPTSYWLDRPLGAMREAAKSLGRRLAREAGIGAGDIAAFIGSGR